MTPRTTPPPPRTYAWWRDEYERRGYHPAVAAVLAAHSATNQRALRRLDDDHDGYDAGWP